MPCRLLCALLFVAWTAESAGDTVVYARHWRSTFQMLGPMLVTIPGIGLSPWQILLLAAVPVCLLRPGAFQRYPWPMTAAMLTSLVSIGLTFGWGWWRGGSVTYAYMQLWKFLSALLMGVLLLSAIRSSRDLKAVGLTVLTAALVRGTLAMYFYWFHVRGTIEPPPDYMTTHEDSLLFVAGLVIMLSWALAQPKRTTWLATVLVSAHLLYAITLNRRRLAWLELVFALAVAYLLSQGSRQRRRLNKMALVLAPVVLAYIAVGWGRGGVLFEPLRALSTSGSDQDVSSLARLEEMRNLLYTLSAAPNPLLGTGWGQPYEKVTSVYANFGDYWQEYAYLPHNSLLGIAVYAGFVGLFGIWLVVPMAAYVGSRGYHGAHWPIDRAAAMAAVCLLPAYSAQCYGDIGFHSFTCSQLLGVALAVAGKAYGWAETARRPASPGPGERTFPSL